ncbi:hypothetical protein B0H19DRAFT_1142476, partial [Mycena capillaripes]
MPLEAPGSVAEIVKLLTSSTPRTPQVPKRLICAIDKCSVADFNPDMTIKSLLPYFAPVGTRYGDPVPAESAIDEHHTKLAGGAVTALGSIVRKYDASTLWPNIVRCLIACWPSTCMGLLFYSRAVLRTEVSVAMLEVDSPAHAFTAIVKPLQMYTDFESLAALLRNTPEVTGLIIRLWALEVRNSFSMQLQEMFPATSPPTTVHLLDIHLLARRDSDSHDLLQIFAMVSSLGNMPIVGISLEHIRRNSSELSRLSVLSVVQNMHASLRNLGCLHSTPLHFLLLSQNSVQVVTEALIRLTSGPSDATSADATADCITQICEYLQKYITSDGLTYLNQSLEVGLLVGLMRAHRWLDHKRSAFDAFMGLLVGHLPKYMIYISVLRGVHKSFNVAQQLGMNALSDVCRQVWFAFETYARLRLKLATDTELDVCSQASSMRFSGCGDAVYCSRECQIAAWNAHSGVCGAWASARQNGILPDFATEEVRFAFRVAQHDFEEHKADFCAQWTEARSLPLTAGIDYVFPHSVNIDASSIVREQMSSDAAIYAVLPQGMSGKEYYMCDLGLTRGTGTDEETIAAVVQMVCAQPLPAFFPIN